MFGNLALRIANIKDSTDRAAAITKFGEKRWLQALNAHQVNLYISPPTTAQLWRFNDEGAPRVCMVRVINSTPEPDGSHKIYWLRVPPDCYNPHQAVAYTFGFQPHAYMPLQET